MAKPRTIAALFIAVTLAGVLFSPFSAVVADNTGSTTVADESITASTTEYVELSGYDIESGSVTVTDSQGTTVDSGNYTVDYEAGAITFSGSGAVSDGESVDVDYTYAATGGTTTTVVQLTPLFLALLILGVLGSKTQDMM
jgi:hypothetical protein